MPCLKPLREAQGKSEPLRAFSPQRKGGLTGAAEDFLEVGWRRDRDPAGRVGCPEGVPRPVLVLWVQAAVERLHRAVPDFDKVEVRLPRACGAPEEARCAA